MASDGKSGAIGLNGLAVTIDMVRAKHTPLATASPGVLQPEVNKAMVDKLKVRYEGSFAEAFAEVCDAFSLDEAERARHRPGALQTWLNNATRYL